MWQNGFISLNWGFFSLLRSLVSISHAEKDYEGPIPKGLAYVTHIPSWIYFFTLATPSVGVRTTKAWTADLNSRLCSTTELLLPIWLCDHYNRKSILSPSVGRLIDDYCLTAGSLQVIVSKEAPINEFKRQPLACGVFGRVWYQGIPELPYLSAQHVRNY